MAYEMDEENGWGAPVVRGFCYKGEAYVPGQWFYGTSEEFTALFRLGVFGQSEPRWLLERRLNSGGGVLEYASAWPRPPKYPRPNALTLGNDSVDWDSVFREQFHVFN